MNPDHNLVIVIALCALAGALIVMMSHWVIQPLILILP